MYLDFQFTLVLLLRNFADLAETTQGSQAHPSTFALTPSQRRHRRRGSGDPELLRGGSRERPRWSQRGKQQREEGRSGDRGGEGPHAGHA